MVKENLHTMIVFFRGVWRAAEKSVSLIAVTDSPSNPIGVMRKKSQLQTAAPGDVSFQFQETAKCQVTAGSVVEVSAGKPRTFLVARIERTNPAATIADKDR